jgi:hypothetical protein
MDKFYICAVCGDAITESDVTWVSWLPLSPGSTEVSYVPTCKGKSCEDKIHG